MQHSFLYDVDKNKIAKQKTDLIYSSFACGIILLIIIFIIILILVRRRKRYERIKKDLEKIVADSNIIKCSLEEKEKVLNNLKTKLEKKEIEIKNKSKEYNKYIDNIKQGLQILQFVCQEKDYVLSESDDRINFIFCYKLIDSDFIKKIEPYITIQEQIFCSLIRLHFSKEQLMFTLSLSNEAFRKVKSRTLTKLKDKSNLKHFCDILRAF